MKDPSPSSPVDHAFESWQQQFRAGLKPEIGVFLAQHPEEIREELRRMITDYLELQEAVEDATSRFEEGQVIGDFQLIQRLGGGGVGDVWEAEQLSLKRRVALKLLKPQFSFSPVSLQRFQREAEAGGRLQHHGIVQTYGVGEYEGIHWIAQELVAGGFTLADSLAQQRDKVELAPGYYHSVARLFQQVAEALEHAHANGVVHRDIKPSNLLIGGDDLPKVTDFGLAQIQDDLGLSRSGEFLGTPFYMSPEQALSKRMGLDHRTDIFSLGATLYEALALIRAFDGDTSQQVFQKIVVEEPPDPRKLRSRTPRDLAVICHKCLEKHPDRRYASMADLAADLGRFLADQAILAQPPSPLQRASKWMRRHPVWTSVSALGAASVTVITLLLVQVWIAKAEAVETAERKSRVLAFLDSAMADSEFAAVGFPTFLDSMSGRLQAARMEPVDEAMAQMAIANAYFGFELFNKASQLLERAASTLEGEFGPDSEEALGAFSRKANALSKMGRSEDAIALHRLVLDKRQQNSTGLNASFFESQNDLAGALLIIGKVDEAEALFKAALKGRREVLPSGDLATMATASNLATILATQGKLQDALELLSMAGKGYLDAYGASHPKVIGILSNKGMVLTLARRFDEAGEVFETVLDSSKGLPEGNQARLTCLYMASRYYYETAQYEEGLPLIQEMLETAPEGSKIRVEAERFANFFDRMMNPQPESDED